MAEEKEIKVNVDSQHIDNPFLSYISASEYKIIKQRLENKTSIACVFMQEDKILFCAIFDLDCEAFHVREVGGYFHRTYDYLDIFSQAFAKFCGKKEITFNTGKRVIAKWAAKKDYLPVGQINSEITEYRKALH